MNINKKTFSIIVALLIILFTSCSPPMHLRKRWMFHAGDREKIVRIAKRYLGVKYKNGGSTPFGFDCSGYVMYVYAKNNIDIPRIVRDQYNYGKRLSMRYAKPGDLVFFRIYGHKVSHVGIYLGNDDFIHSPKKGKRVSCAKINDNYWGKRYAGIVTYFQR